MTNIDRKLIREIIKEELESVKPFPRVGLYFMVFCCFINSCDGTFRQSDRNMLKKIGHEVGISDNR
jgi:hypothetical protein